MHKVEKTTRPADPSTPDPRPLLSWPPPGLGRLQADAYTAARWLAAAALLTIPLMAAVLADRDPGSMGFLADTVWLPIVLGLAGMVTLVAGYIVLVRFLKRAAHAARSGYRWALVALVAADHRRDAGFLLQGGRAYSMLKPAARRTLVWSRVLTAGAALGTAIWLSLGFSVGVVLAARGLISPPGLALLIAVPAGALATVALLSHAWEEGAIRRARRAWHRKSWKQDLLDGEVRQWMSAWADQGGILSLDEGAGTTRRGLGFRVGAVAAAVSVAVALIPLFVLIFATALGSVLVAVGAPRFGQIQARIAVTEPYRAYALPADGSTSAAEAGEIFHLLTFVGEDPDVSPAVRPPVRVYSDPWFPPDPDGPAVTPAAYLDWLEDPNTPPEPEVVAAAMAAAEHPAHEEISRLAMATEADLAGGRWQTPFPDEVSATSLWIPRFGNLREGANARLAKAAVESARGDVDAAEQSLREVLTAGFLLAADGPLLIDNLVGVVITGIAGGGLEALYRGAGRPEADQLAAARELAAKSSEISLRGAPPVHGPTAIRAMPAMVVDDDLLRGMRWELLMSLHTFGPCTNPSRMVFGPTPEHEAWLAQAASSLVRWPAETDLFDLLRSGAFGSARGPDPDLRTRFFTLTMGAASREGSCGRVVAELLTR